MAMRCCEFRDGNLGLRLSGKCGVRARIGSRASEKEPFSECGIRTRLARTRARVGSLLRALGLTSEIADRVPATAGSIPLLGGRLTRPRTATKLDFIVPRLWDPGGHDKGRDLVNRNQVRTTCPDVSRGTPLRIFAPEHKMRCSVAACGTIVALNLCVLTSMAADWPTLHKDYQRSGYTEEVVRGPYQAQVVPQLC